MLSTYGFCLQSDSLNEEEWSASLPQGTSSWVSVTRTVATISIVIEGGVEDIRYPMATFPPSHKTWLWSVLNIHKDVADTLKLHTDE